MINPIITIYYLSDSFISISKIVCFFKDNIPLFGDEDNSGYGFTKWAYFPVEDS